jgi:hypothetical protein
MTKRLVAGMTLMASVLVMMATVFGSAAAQETGTPAASGNSLHPAHIHAGTCDTLGDVVFPLNDVGTGDSAATPMATPDLALASTPDPNASLQSTTMVAAAIDDVMGAEHAINVHLSAEQMDVYIACGDVTGDVTDGVLTVDLQELNGSGVSGQATLTDNGDGTITVEIHLMQGGTGMATPAA